MTRYKLGWMFLLLAQLGWVGCGPNDGPGGECSDGSAEDVGRCMITFWRPPGAREPGDGVRRAGLPPAMNRPETDIEPRLKILSTRPAAGESGVLPAAIITVTLSESLSPETVSASTFLLEKDGVPVAGRVSVSSNVARFEPAAPLVPGGRYTATLLRGIESVLGGVLEETRSWAFIVREAQWGRTGVVLQDKPIGGAGEPQVAMDAKGQAVTLWTQHNVDRDEIWFSRHAPGSGWSAGAALDSSLAGSSGEPRLGLRADGHALAIWSHFNEVHYAIWFSEQAPGEPWSRARSLLPEPFGDASNPHLAMDPATGTAFAVWLQFDGFRETVWSARHLPGQGWDQLRQLDDGSWEDSALPRIAVNANGAAVAVWTQAGGSVGTLWARHYGPDSGWGPAQRIDPVSTFDTQMPDVALSSTGEALAVWLQWEKGLYVTYSGHFLPGHGWGKARRIDAELPGHASGPRIALDPRGNAIAIWSRFDGAAESILTNRYSVGFGWDTARFLEGEEGTARAPRLAIDGAGNAAAVWQQEVDGHIRVRSSRYVAAVGWGLCSVVSPEVIGDATEPALALGPGEQGMAVWRQTLTEEGTIVANRYQ